MTELCSHPTCYESSDNATIYKEPTDHNERGWIPVCGKHADLSKDGVTVLMSDDPDPAEVANAEILGSLKR